MTDAGEVLFERRGPAAWITLNRPGKLNAMNGAMVRQLRERLHEVESDDTVKVVVLTGAGRAFSAGYDISEEVHTASKARTSGAPCSPRTSTWPCSCGRCLARPSRR